MKLIVQLNESIIKEIEIFYIQNSIKLEEEIDPDINLSLFIYIISQSDETYLGTNCNIINFFSNEELNSSFSGYYLCVVETAIEFLKKKFKENISI